jgi:hypothetical protein
VAAVVGGLSLSRGRRSFQDATNRFDYGHLFYLSLAAALVQAEDLVVSAAVVFVRRRRCRGAREEGGEEQGEPQVVSKGASHRLCALVVIVARISH